MSRLVPFLLAIVSLSACAGHPSDRTMIDLFNAHREEFQKLADEAMTDPAVVVREPYRQRLAALGIRAALPRPPEEVQFYVSAEGLVTHGSSKDFIYTRTTPDRLLDSLDGNAVKPYGYAYRRIDEDWYLYLYRD